MSKPVFNVKKNHITLTKMKFYGKICIRGKMSGYWPFLEQCAASLLSRDIAMNSDYIFSNVKA